jgi:hypothetical protein
MKKKHIELRDPVVEKVIDKFIQRSDVGFKKYGITMQDDNSDLIIWLNHLQEELMDAILYIQKNKDKINDK